MRNSLAIVFFGLAMFGASRALAQLVCLTLPLTNIRDYSKPCSIVQESNAYPTIPGTSVRDYSKPGVKFEG